MLLCASFLPRHEGCQDIPASSEGKCDALPSTRTTCTSRPTTHAPVPALSSCLDDREDDFSTYSATQRWHLRCRIASKMSSNSGTVSVHLGPPPAPATKANRPHRARRHRHDALPGTRDHRQLSALLPQRYYELQVYATHYSRFVRVLTSRSGIPPNRLQCSKMHFPPAGR